MGKKNKCVLILLSLLVPLCMSAQLRKLSSEKQQLFIQLSLNYYTVVKEGRVDQDSSLLLVTRKNKLSRWTVIMDGFGNGLTLTDNKWVDTRQPWIASSRLSKLRNLAHLKVLVMLGAYYAYQPGYHQADRDSAQYYLSQAKKESESLHSIFWLNQTLCILGKNYFKGQKIKEGMDCFQLAITSCQQTGDKLTEAKAWDLQGSYIPPNESTLKLIIESLEKATKIYQKTGALAKEVNSRMNLSYIYFLLKALKVSENNALAALALQDKLNFPYLHYTYDILSLIGSITGSEHKDLTYEMKAIKSSIATKDSLGLAYFYTRMGHTKFGPKETSYAFSDYYLKKGLEIFTLNRDPDIYMALVNYVSNLNGNGKSAQALQLLQRTLKSIPPSSERVGNMVNQSIAESYLGLKNYKLAEKYYLLTEQIHQRDTLVTKNMRSAQIKYVLGMFYFQRKDYAKADNYLQKYISLTGPKDNEIVSLSEVHRILYKLDSIRGNYQSAARHLQDYISLNNKYNSANDAKSIAGLKLQVLMTQKEKDIQLLQANSEMQQQQARSTKIYIYIGLGIALLIIIMLYSRYYINQRQKNAIFRKNRQLLKVIKEKNELIISREWLLKEVHHRVKNNLHTVICLLESQAGYLENDALKALEISQHRIYAMSLIHQKLYQSDDIKTVDMSTYLPEFVSYLSDSFDTGNRIRFDISADPIKLGVAYAVPLSLIINEAVTNAIKYAFPDARNGVIDVSLTGSDDHVILRISDNGIGIAQEHLTGSSAKLGLKLLRGLSDDIKADSNIENNDGTKITIDFRVEELMLATLN
ncbi:tetratricopeptide repeat-containing sensor histidine kinase [Pedobacter jamesrossensis]|uniref:histidine kinase n=1 Tax=Pedobacter jamesrossensis TaxID=1908238 RepID=A0ABV8NKU7_9SPHI